eukprot:scaffold122299_cov37-Tisochrysis_lutea.AAC.2
MQGNDTVRCRVVQRLDSGKQRESAITRTFSMRALSTIYEPATRAYSASEENRSYVQADKAAQDWQCRFGKIGVRTSTAAKNG